MGLKSVQGDAGTLIFNCVRCKSNGDESARTVNISDLTLRSTPQIIAMDLPKCPTCGSGSTMFFVPSEAAMNGAMAHLRAIILKKCYDAGGGDGNADLSDAKAALEKITTSYDDNGTTLAKDQFLGNEAFTELDRTTQPLK